VKKTSGPILSLFYITAIILLFSSFLPLASANTNCPCDDLDTCVQWVSEGSLSIQWGRTATQVVNDITYTFRADDFDEDLGAALISIEKGGVVRKEFLFLNGDYDRKWLEWDNEVKVELTDITEDGQKTPSAHVEIFSRGRPELEITIEASSETVDGVDVSSEQYAPGEEKHIDVEVKNTGEAWIENAILNVDIGEFRLKAKGDFEYRDGIIKKNLGCLEVGDTASINFTIVAPEWDGKTSPYELIYYVNATAGGYDIKDGYFDADSSYSFGCTDPDMKVVFEIVDEEINMTSWYVREFESSTYSRTSKDYEIRDAWEYSFLRTHVYNTGLYTVDDLTIDFTQVPDEFVIYETYESGSYRGMAPDGQYYLGQKLIPIRQGEYPFDSVVATANFFGKEFTWNSESGSITVHGPHVILSKSLSGSGTDYSVTLKAYNDGDRASWVNLTDIIPYELSYVGGSLEKSLEGSDLPLSEWDLSVSRVNGIQIVSVEGVLLPPGSTLTFGYDFSSSSAPDLPPAVCEFRGIGNYDGEAQSSFYVGGSEVKQYWEPLNGGWISNPEDLEVTTAVALQPEPEEEDVDEDLYSVEDEIPEALDISLEVQQESLAPTFLSNIIGSIEGLFNKMQQFVGNTFSGVLSGFTSIFGMAENAAIDAVENYLYAIVIVIALAVFALVSTLITK